MKEIVVVIQKFDETTSEGTFIQNGDFQHAYIESSVQRIVDKALAGAFDSLPPKSKVQIKVTVTLPPAAPTA